MGRVKRIWYLSPLRAAKVQACLRIRAVSPEPPLLAHTSSESRGTFRQKARSLAPRNGWECAVKICHDGMLEDTNSLDAAQMSYRNEWKPSIDVLLVLFHWMWRNQLSNGCWGLLYETNSNQTVSCIPDKGFRDFHPFWIFPSYTRGCKTTSCMTSGSRR